MTTTQVGPDQAGESTSPDAGAGRRTAAAKAATPAPATAGAKRSTAPAAKRSPAPAAKRSPAPAAKRSSAPAAKRTSAAAAPGKQKKAKGKGKAKPGKAGKGAKAESAGSAPAENGDRPPKVPKKVYEAELERMQVELVQLSHWVTANNFRIGVVFEGRDAAGKGGVIARIREHLSPRVCRVAALPAPTERERTQWYFQRYVEQLPAGGEIVLFDRSWYNRAGVERVMGFCTPAQHREFLRQCPVFEHLLVDSGMLLIKYWFSVSDAEQERRFQSRVDDPLKRWKLSPMDLESRRRWVDYSRAKDEMFVHTDTAECPWFVVEADDKPRARLNCIADFLSRVPYMPESEPALTLPERQSSQGYVRPPRDTQNYVTDHASTLLAKK